MTSWKGWSWLVGVSLVAALAGCTQPVAKAARQKTRVVQNTAPTPAAVRPTIPRDNPPVALPQVPVANTVYSTDEIHQFVTAARAAESIKDQLQSCLAYPDPPHSHWSHEAVVAYCNYRHQPMISLAEINALIRKGKTTELDHRLAAALHAQLTQPGSAGLLDEIYKRAFGDDLARERPLLDAWKHASPNSAFAYAASGYNYVQMAAEARGEDYESRTPSSKLRAMRGLLALAESDLQQALAWEPRLTPAYVVWIQGANIGRNRDFIDGIVERGLAAVPSDYSIYSIMMGALQPKWHGSLGEMEQMAKRAQAHAADNPLLKILPTYAPYYQTDNCDCDAKIQLANYHAIFDQLPTTAYLQDAGDLASANNHEGMALVYLSEALRFQPDGHLDKGEQANRSFSLSYLGYPHWALAEANNIVAANPNYNAGFCARGLAYEGLEDYPHAITALRRAIELDPGASWQLIELGNIYGYQTREWNKAREIGDQIIRKFPDLPNGWVLRAKVQMDEPRAGLKDTYDQFNARFGSDPDRQEALSEMREALKQQAGSGGLSRTSTKLPLH